MKPIIDIASKSRLQQMDKDEIIALYLKQTREFQSAFDSLIERIALANTRHFGSSSEHLIPEQISLFNDMEAACEQETPEPRVEFEKGRKKSRKRDLDLSKLPSVTIEHELPQEEQVCPACENMLTDIKVETTYQLVYVPARFEVEKHNRHVYVCKDCSKRNEAGEDIGVSFLRASAPAFPIAKSVASPSLLAYILDAKYVNSLPLYRIEADLKRNTGVKIARRNMANWTLRVADDYLRPLYEAMHEELLTKDVLHCDETTVQVLKEPGRSPSSKSYMWLFASGRHDIPIYLFEYHPTRAATVVETFLDGWSGTIHADGYRAYYNLGDGITVIGCLAHVRRKFCDIVKSVGEEQAKETTAYTAVSKLDAIFAIERDLAELAPEQRMVGRSELLKGKLDDLHHWLLDVHSAAVPKMALAKAVDYALEQWPYIVHVLDDGRFEITNNRAERGIRPFAVGRKNWLFSDSPRGAHASAIIYSVIRTAMANGLKPYAYLEWLFSEMPGCDLTRKGSVSRFLPWSADVPVGCHMEAGEITKKVETQCEAIVDIDPHYLDDQDSD